MAGGPQWTAVALLASVGVGVCSMAGAAQIVGVKALPKKLVVTVTGDGRPAKLAELRPYESYGRGADGEVVWRGRCSERAIEVRRFARERDRLYSKFQLVDLRTDEPLGEPHYADDLGARP